MWKVGDRLAHRYNSDLGPGRVVEVLGRGVRVEFPYSGDGELLSFAANSDALAPLILAAGSRARIEATDEIVVVEAGVAENRFLLADGREMSLRELWPLPEEVSPIDRLARGEIGAWEDFANRLDGLCLERLRQAHGLGSFLGGRIRLFPHQLYVAERACRSDQESAGEPSPVRWLLADEVGLGKTVEACLIMNRLIHTGRAERTLVVAPESLTVQWLGELWRKHHQIFVLLDEKRLADVERDYGQGFNPFEVYRQSIVSLELLRSRRQLSEQATEVGIDLLVVDEAHHLKRPRGHPGNAAWRAVEPIAARQRSVLLLTATPLEEDAQGFFRLLQMLCPDELTEESFDDWLGLQKPLPPCTSATRRVDVGGLPPRLPKPVEFDADPEVVQGWQHLKRLEGLERSRPLARGGERRKADRVFRALASPAALLGRLDASDSEGLEATTLARDADPRVDWLVEAVSGWHRSKEKTLVFVAHRESLDLLKSAIEQRSVARVGIFHEGLSLKRRDLEVAQFRLPDGPTLLISTESGGEGRNFEFCRRLVLFDLPWSPATVEQRIGRLDRIGRTQPTEIVFFRPPGGLGRAIVRLYEEIGLFSEPLGALDRELRHVQQVIERVAVDGPDDVDQGVFEAVLDEARSAGARVREAAYHELHRESYRQEMADEILSRVPDALEILNEEVVLRAAARFGFEIDQQSGDRTWLIEHGAQSLVDHLPGVTPGSRFLGTFDRATAVASETVDFFASGHPLVEGILAELEGGARGRVALVQVPGEEEVFGLLAIYRHGADFEAIAIDGRGQRRDDLAKLLASRDVEREHIEARKWTSQPSWKRGIRRLASSLPDDEMPTAVAAFRIRRVSN